MERREGKRSTRTRPATLRDVMTSKVIVVSPDMTMRDVAAVFSEAHISGAPVVSGGRVVGVVSASDLLDFAAAPPISADAADADAGPGGDVDALADASPAEGDWPGSAEPPAEFFLRYWADRGLDVYERLVECESGREDRWIDGFPVADVMSRRLHALPPETPLSEGADYMLAHEIHRILVMEGDRLVGMVTTADMVRAMA